MGRPWRIVLGICVVLSLILTVGCYYNSGRTGVYQNGEPLSLQRSLSQNSGEIDKVVRDYIKVLIKRNQILETLSIMDKDGNYLFEKIDEEELYRSLRKKVDVIPELIYVMKSEIEYQKKLDPALNKFMKALKSKVITVNEFKVKLKKAIEGIIEMPIEEKVKQQFQENQRLQFKFTVPESQYHTILSGLSRGKIMVIVDSTSSSSSWKVGHASLKIVDRDPYPNTNADNYFRSAWPSSDGYHPFTGVGNERRRQWNVFRRGKSYALRVKGASAANERNAVRVAINIPDGTPYSIFTSKTDRSKFYCSKVVWYSWYYGAHKDLDVGWHYIFDYLNYWVFPGDILLDNDTEIVETW